MGFWRSSRTRKSFLDHDSEQILGGVFESPSENFPKSFLAKIPLLQSFPYILPTLIAGTILVTGSVLACFLSWDGGVRGGSRIALAVEKNEPLNGVSPARSSRDRSASPAESTLTAVPSMRNRRNDLLSPRDESGPNGPPHARRDSRASLGTAYGYVTIA